MNIGLQISYDRGQFDRLRDKLNAFERQRVYHQSTVEVAEFLREQLATYPPYRYVSRKAAYGVTFFTARQRRWFFAALRSGELRLPYARTGGLGAGWQVVEQGNAVRLMNVTPYAQHVQDGALQARMMQIIGWQTTGGIATRYDGEIGRVALRALDAWVAEVNAA